MTGKKYVLVIVVTSLLEAQTPWGKFGGKSTPPAKQAPAAKPQTAPLAAAKPSPDQNVVRMKRVTEPREGAFTILVPEGWTTEGGILRINPLTAGGAANTVSAKVDFTVKRDAAGSVLLHFVPSMTYKDPRGLIAPRPIGSDYMGAMVLPIMNPQTYAMQMVFRPLHPQAQNVQIIEQRPAPQVVQSIQQQVGSLPANAGYSWDAGSVTVSYTENGVAYKEKYFAIIENTGQMGLLTWSNKETVRVRAPAAEFEQSIPLLETIQASLVFNPKWVAGERMGSAQRAAMAWETQKYIAKQAQEMVESRRRMHAEIRHSMWLNMSNQEDYINPYTGEVEQGSNQWKYRWVNGSGDVIYTNDPNYDPNWDQKVRRTDYKRTPVRPR